MIANQNQKNALCLLKNNNNFVCLASQYTASLEKLHEICPTSSVKWEIFKIILGIVGEKNTLKKSDLLFW